MSCVNSDKFSASDLSLFIESIEVITRMERRKKERAHQRRAQYLADTLRFMDQKYPAGSSSTLSSTDDPEEESVLESIEEKQIGCHYAVKDLLYTSTCDEKQLSYDECTGVIQNVYCQIEDGDDADNECEVGNNSYNSCTYSVPLDCLESTKISRVVSLNNIYDQISPARGRLGNSSKSSISYAEPTEIETTVEIDSYAEPLDVVKKKSFKRTLLGLVCKKYRQRQNSKSSNNWCKSESWVKLTAV